MKTTMIDTPEINDFDIRLIPLWAIPQIRYIQRMGYQVLKFRRDPNRDFALIVVFIPGEGTYYGRLNKSDMEVQERNPSMPALHFLTDTKW